MPNRISIFSNVKLSIGSTATTDIPKDSHFSGNFAIPHYKFIKNLKSIDKKIKILLVFGTRPEAIKMSPLAHEFKKNSIRFDTKVCVTAQHREMLDQVLNFFKIDPDYDLNLMKPDQNLNTITSEIIIKMKDVFERF